MRCFVLAFSFLVWLSAPLTAHPELPTPLTHYEHYDFESEGRAFLLRLALELPEATQARAAALWSAGDGEAIDVGEARALLEEIDWKRFRPELQKLLLHGSRVLEAIPEDASEWLPLVHDAFLLFLERLGEERFLERLTAQARLPRDASRGERILAFVVNTPSLQKLAQILARHPSLAPDIRESLQELENGLATARYDDVMAVLEREISPETAEAYRLRIADRILAEASVGAVVEATFVAPGSDRVQRAACKVLKPHAVAALGEDLAIIDSVLAYLETNGAFYGIGAAPLVDIFEEIREALSREIRVEDERRNLIRAGEYYKDSTTVDVPEVYSFSTPNVTCMEYIDGVKITEAFVERPRERARLARRLSDALTYDVLFSPQESALFHGDPHAGNVFHVSNSVGDPYRIALLDWGLVAEFTREDRQKMVQLMLGLHLRHAKRIANNADVLVDWSPETPEERAELRRLAEELLSHRGEDGMFELLDELVTALAREGHPIRFEPAMFIKSQLTIAGILTELDPSFEQDRYVMGRISGQVYREIGTRLLRTVWFPAWNSHDYTSMMSNEDVKDVQFRRVGRAFKKAGKGIWTAVSFRWLWAKKPPDDAGG